MGLSMLGRNFRCITFGLLATGLTVSLVACNFITNDLRDQKIPGSELAYDSHAAQGTSAHEILSAEHFKNLDVEIQYLGEFQPTQEALNRMQKFLEAHLNKQITILPPEQISYGPFSKMTSKSYAVNDLFAIEDQNRKHFTTKGHLVAYYLFLDGGSHDDTMSKQILGQSYRNTSMAIFEKTIQDQSDKNPVTQPLPTPSASPSMLPFPGFVMPPKVQPPLGLLEATVMAHEFGHILGLVDVSTKQTHPHVDKDGFHCVEPNCLMNANIETSAISISADIPAFGPECLLDLKNNGGR